MTDDIFDINGVVSDNGKPYAELKVHRGLTEIETLFFLVSAMGGYIAGDYARYCLSPLPKPAAPSDVDIFCKTEDAYTKILETLKERGAKVDIETTNAASLKPPANWVSCPKIQLINPTVMVGDPWSVISRFDFTIAIAALTTSGAGIAHKNFEEDEYAMRLKVNYIQCPVGNMRRALKYCNKGYKFPVREMIKFYKDWETKSEERRQQILDLVDMDPKDWTVETRESFRDLIYVD